MDARRKLTSEQAVEIRKDRRSIRALATVYGVHSSTIQRIKKGKLYQDAGTHCPCCGRRYLSARD